MGRKRFQGNSCKVPNGRVKATKLRDWRTKEPLVGGANDALRNVLESYWMMMFSELQVRSSIHGLDLNFNCRKKMTIILLKKVSFPHNFAWFFIYCYIS